MINIKRQFIICLFSNVLVALFLISTTNILAVEGNSCYDKQFIDKTAQMISAYNHSSPIPLDWEFGTYTKFRDDHGYVFFATSDLHIQPFYEYHKEYDEDFYYPIKGIVEFRFYGLLPGTGAKPNPDLYLTSCLISFSGQYIKLLDRVNLTNYTHFLKIDETKWIKKLNNSKGYNFDSYSSRFWARPLGSDHERFKFSEDLTEIKKPYTGGMPTRWHYASYYKAKYNTTPEQDEEYDSGFIAAEHSDNIFCFGHNNNFSNDQSDFFLDIYPKPERYFRISKESGLFQKLLSYAGTNGERNFLKGKNKREWKGACYGISATMALAFLGKLSIPDRNKQKVPCYFQLEAPKHNTYFRDIIHYYHESQFLYKYGADGLSELITYDLTRFKLDSDLGVPSFLSVRLDYFLSRLVEDAKEAARNGRVLMLSYRIAYTDKKGKQKEGGHTILITGYKYVSKEEKYYLKLYDLNYFDNKPIVTYMTIPKDFKTFSINATAGPITEKNYHRLRYIDPREFENIKFTSSIIHNENPTNFVFVNFTSDSSFKLTSDIGLSLTYENSEFSGDLPVFSLDYIDNEINIKTAYCSSYKIEPISRDIDINIYDNDHFKAVVGNNIESIDLSIPGDIRLNGKTYTFKAYASVEEMIDDKESGMGSISAKVKGEVVIHKGQDTIEAVSENPMSHIETKIYQGVEVIEGKIKGKQNSVVIKPCEETIGTSTSIEDGMIIFSKQGYAYRGRPIKPFVSVYVGGKSLKKNKEFKVQYENNVEIGTGKLTVVGVGEYSGTLSAEFPIIPKKVKMKKVSSCKLGFEVTWNSSGPKDGFEIQYDTDPDFRKAKTKKIEDGEASSAQVEGLVVGTECFVRVRSYKTVDDQIFYSNWSDVKSVLIYPY